MVPLHSLYNTSCIWFPIGQVFKSNIWPNSTSLQDTSPQNLSDVQLDISTFQGHSRSNLIVQLDFLLVSNSNHMAISHCLAVIDIRNFFSHLLSLGQNLDCHTHPYNAYPRTIFLKIYSLHLWIMIIMIIGKTPTTNEVDWLNTFLRYLVNSHPHNDALNITINPVQQSWWGLKICENILLAKKILVEDRKRRMIYGFAFHT